MFNSFLYRHYTGYLEERRLHDHVDPVAQTDLLAQSCSVDGVEVDIVLCQISLDVSRQMCLKFFVIPNTVEYEGAALLQSGKDVVLSYVCLVVYGYEVSFVYQIC